LRSGRPEKTTHREIERVAFELFARNGFEATTVGDIADALGVSRRTVFRYFSSKNDIVWGDFDWVIGRLRDALRDSSPDEPLLEAVARAVVFSNSYPEGDLDQLRTRITLITSVPALQAHSMLRYRAWRQAVAAFVAERLGVEEGSLAPQVVAHAALGTSMAAFARWARNRDDVLAENLEQAFGVLLAGARGER